MINKLILYYHSIGYTPLSINPDLFDNQLKILKSRGFVPRLISDIYTDKISPQEKSVFLTFDDCFADNYEYAVPLILKNNFCATFYAVPGYDNLIMYGDPNIKKWSTNKDSNFTIPFNFFGKKERKHLNELGMEIGCHSFSHPNLDNLNYNEQHYEILTAKEIIESDINCKVNSFCYPRGRYNQSTITILKALDFSNATTTNQRYLDSSDIIKRFEIPRFGGPNTLEVLNSLIKGKGKDLDILTRIKMKIKSKLN